MDKGIHNRQKKIASINDMSGFGRCSLAAALPLISRLGVQCCPLPTAILSNHTGFEDFYFYDFTSHMREYMAQWKKLDLRFDGIMSGFLGSALQIDIVREFLDLFDDGDCTVIIDPVMGDYGKLYSTYTQEMCEEMKLLVDYADILTPNTTEACILTGTPYKESFCGEELFGMAEKLSDQGPDKVVITGVDRGSCLENYCYEAGRGKAEREAAGKAENVPCTRTIQRTPKVASQRSGTGDVFSAIVAAGAVRGISFTKSVETAADFIRTCLIRSEELGIPVTDGVCFEEVIGELDFI